MASPAATPKYHYATDNHRSDSDEVKSVHEGRESMSHGFQRPPRQPGQLELGITEIAEGRTDAQRQVVASGGISTSQFRAKWQGKKPEWLCAFLAEALGVWFFTIAGAASTASFIIGEGAGIELSSFLQIGLTYAIGIALAINTAAMTSGGHFHPAVSICQTLFRGFPARKLPLYIAGQLTGGFVAGLMIYAINREPLDLIATGLRLKGQEAVIFSSSGPAGAIALFPAAGRSYGTMFMNEFFGSLFIGFVIWSQIDAQNIFTSPVAAGYTIGLAYFVVVSGFAPGAIALNTARDVGARFACGAIYGSQCFPAKYTALAALTNIPATIIAVALYTFIFSDSRRPPAPLALGHLLAEEKEAHLHATKTHDELMERKITSHGDGSNSDGLFKRISRAA